MSLPQRGLPEILFSEQNMPQTQPNAFGTLLRLPPLTTSASIDLTTDDIDHQHALFSGHTG